MILVCLYYLSVFVEMRMLELAAIGRTKEHGVIRGNINDPSVQRTQAGV